MHSFRIVALQYGVTAGRNLLTLQPTFLLLLFCLLLFGAYRTAIYLSYPQAFADLTSSELAQSYLMGLRVDIKTLFSLLLIPVLLLHLPGNLQKNRVNAALISLCFALIISAALLYLAIDYAYFGTVNRHIVDEWQYIDMDWQSLVTMTIQNYSIVLLLYFMTVAIVGYLSVKLIYVAAITRQATRVTTFLLLFCIFAVAIRGTFSSKPLGLPDAFIVAKQSSGNLALNGLFTSYFAANSVTAEPLISYQDALPIAQPLLLQGRAITLPEISPVAKRYPVQSVTEKPNIVVITLESWTAEYIDAIAGTNFQVTPTFDALAKDGLLFTRFYANSQRSISGITAMLSGNIPLPGLPQLGYGLELSNMSLLGKIAQQNGYHTLAIQSSNRDSFRVGSIAKIAGFQQYFGAEDIPATGEETKERAPLYGVWDGDMLRFLQQQLQTIEQPFISYAFTATTHFPFISPGLQWQKYPHDNETRDGYLNTLLYSDAMVGEFMHWAKQQPWFNNTIFILTADHTVGTNVQFADEVKAERNLYQQFANIFHIPLLIYAPKLLQPQTITTLGSQIDLLPTIANLASWPNTYCGFGQDLLDNSIEKRFALFQAGLNIGLLSPETFILHNQQTVIAGVGDNQQMAVTEQNLLAISSIQQYLLQQNLWCN